MEDEEPRASEAVRRGVMRGAPALAMGAAVVCYGLAKWQRRKRPWAWGLVGATNPLLVPAWLLLTGRRKPTPES